MNTAWEILAEPFVWSGIATALLTAAVCAWLGVFVVLKRIVFVSVAMAEVAGLGVAFGFFFGLNPQFAAIGFTFLAALLFWLYAISGRAGRENLVGYIYCLAAALGIILLAMNPLAHAHGLDIVSGNFLYARRPEIMVLAFISGLVMVGQVFFGKEFMTVSFDRDFARSTGIRAAAWEFLLYLSLGLVISVSMRLSGLVYVFGSLLIPALAGLLLGRRISAIFIIAVVFALVNTLAGFSLALVRDLPPAPTMVALYGLVLGLLLAGRRLLLRLGRGR